MTSPSQRALVDGQRFVDEMVISVGSGRSFADSLAIAGSACGGRWREIAADLIVADVIDGDLDRALDDWSLVASGDDSVIAFGCLFGHRVGGDLGRALGATAVVVRERRRLRDDVAVQVAQVRASVVALGAAPLAFVALAALAGMSPLSILFATPSGRLALAAAVGLELGGLVWMRALVRRVDR